MHLKDMSQYSRITVTCKCWLFFSKFCIFFPVISVLRNLLFTNLTICSKHYTNYIFLNSLRHIPGLCLLFSSEANSRTNSLVDCCLMIVVVDFLFPVDFLETRTMILVINSDMAQLILQSAKENQLELNGYVQTCYTLSVCHLQTADCWLH